MKIYNEDCLEILKTIPDETIDLVVTDCPYHIIGGGCSTGTYGNGNGIFTKNPGGIFNKDRNREYVKDEETGRTVLKGTKHVNLGGVFDDDITYTRQGKLFKHNDIKFSEWLPDLYRVMKSNTHIYIYI